MRIVGGLALCAWGLFMAYVFGRFLIGRLRGERLPSDNLFVMLAIFVTGLVIAFAGIAVL